MDENLQKLEKMIGMLDNQTTMDEFVKAFGMAIEHIQTMQKGKDGMTPIKGVHYRDGRDGRDGQDGFTPIKGVHYFDGKDGEDGIGIPGKDGKDGKDGSPDTPDQVVEKVNSSSKLIKKERVEGLVDAIANIASNAMASVGITTTHFLKNGTLVGRAKNINIIEGTNVTATLYQMGDQMNIQLTSTAGSVNIADAEVPTDSGDHINFTLAHTPTAGTFKLYRGGARQKGGGVDYTQTGTALVLVTALATGEVLIADYTY